MTTLFYSPHLCVGFLFLILYPAAPSPPPPPPPPPPPCPPSFNLCQPPSFTHHLSHTSWSHTIFHTPSVTHIFFTHHLSHTSLSHTSLSHTICHTPSVTHNLTQTSFPHHLSHRGTLRGRRGTCWHSPSTLRGRRGAWWHPPSTLRGRRGRRGALWHLLSFCVVGVALRALGWLWESGGALGLDWSPVTPRHFAWQAWHLATSAFLSRGRRGTSWHLLSFCTHNFVTHTHNFVTHKLVTHNFVTHHLSHTTLPHTTLSPTISPTQLCHTWWHPPSFHVAGVALGDMHLHFTWQARHLVTSTFVSRGRRGTRWHPPSFHVAGLALGDIHLRFTWQAWHLETTCVRRGRRGTSCTWWRAWSPLLARGAAPLCVAGVALGDIPLRFTCQAWRKLHFVARLVTVGRPGRRATLRGRRGTWWHPPSFHVAGVSFGDIYLRSAWQARHKLHLVARLVAVGRPGRRATLRGRRGTWWHPPSFHTQLCHTPSFSTPSLAHNIVTHHFLPYHVSHTALWHNIFHTQLCHTLSFTHNFHTHHLSHTTLSHIPFFFVTHHLSHTTLSHTTLHIQLVFLLDHPLHPLSFLPSPSPLQHL